MVQAGKTGPPFLPSFFPGIEIHFVLFELSSFRSFFELAELLEAFFMKGSSAKPLARDSAFRSQALMAKFLKILFRFVVFFLFGGASFFLLLFVGSVLIGLFFQLHL